MGLSTSVRLANLSVKPKCVFAHSLAELSVVSSTQYASWAWAWSEGKVDSNVWRNDWRSEKAKLRARASPKEGLGNRVVQEQDVPKYLLILGDYDWPKLQNAWEQGKASEGTKSGQKRSGEIYAKSTIKEVGEIYAKKGSRKRSGKIYAKRGRGKSMPKEVGGNLCQIYYKRGRGNLCQKRV